MLDKKNLRESMFLKRKNITNKIEKDALITETLLSFIDTFSLSIKDRKTKIFSYVSIGAEVDTKKILYYYINNDTQKKEIYVPFTFGEINLVPLKKSDILVADKLGNIADLKNREKYFSSVDITIAPMLAFNKELFRLGYGGGYYDKFLHKNKSLKIGLAYDEQYSNELETEEHDVKLDIIITPSKILRSTNESNCRQV